MASNPPKQGFAGLKLYPQFESNAPELNTPGLITRGPALNKQEEKKDEKKTLITPGFLPSVLNQQVKRPQPKQNKKKKGIHPMHAAWSRTSVPATSSSSPDKVAAQPARPRFQDFLTNEDEDVNGFNKTGNQRQRGGRGKKNKKNQWQDWQEEKPEVDWDAPSDPRQKTDVVEYRKTAMERHRYNIGLSETVNASHPKTDSLNKSSEEEEVLTGNVLSCPPANPDSAPPTTLDPSGRSSYGSEAATADDADAHGIKLSHAAAAKDFTHPLSPTQKLLSDAVGASPNSNPTEPQSAISEATAPTTQGKAEEEGARTNRPGQKGFARRMMAKMGHVEGKGLGAKQDGIITPLQQQQTKQQFLGQNSKAQTEKRKRGQGEQGSRPVKRPAMGRIVGGKKAKGTEDDDEPYGPMSAVVVVFGFLKGVDLEADNNRDDGGIRQEIGEACGAKYGTVEKVYPYVDSECEDIPVYIKFTNQLSAYKAVQDFNKPEYKFHGNRIALAQYYDTEKFDQGIYDNFERDEE